jgi:hypothetical protein
VPFDTPGGGGSGGGSLFELQKGDSGSSTTASGSAATVLTNNTTPGNCLILYIFIGEVTDTVKSVVSSIGSFGSTPVVGNSQNQNDMEIWFCSNITGQAKTVTVTSNGGNAYYALALEVSGAASYTAYSGGSSVWGNNTTHFLTVTPQAAGDFVAIGGVCPAMSAWPGSPWSDYNGSAAWAHANGSDVAWQAVPSTAPVTATWMTSYGNGNLVGIDVKA